MDILKLNKTDQIIWSIYRELYKNAEPSADFDELYDSAKINSEGQREIPFMEYTISEEDFDRIVEEHFKGKRLTKLKKNSIRMHLYLGVTPKFKNNKL